MLTDAYVDVGVRALKAHTSHHNLVILVISSRRRERAVGGRDVQPACCFAHSFAQTKLKLTAVSACPLSVSYGLARLDLSSRYIGLITTASSSAAARISRWLPKW